MVCAAGLAASACRSALPPPPYERSFAVEAGPRRVLSNVQEITVPLTLTNTGTRPWDPSRVHVSYHWLWLVPREIVLRSRTLPYHEGIRTDLPAAVPPGGSVTVEARLLAPAMPGLYWLQWDMVEEGVVWFAQVSPRPARRLFVVLPVPAAVFAPVPIVVAVAGLVLLGRRRPLGGPAAVFAATADVWWCVAVLWAKPLILVRDALLEPTAVAYWLTMAAAAGPPVLLLVVLPRRARPWVLVGIGTFATLLMLADVIYYRFFGDVVSAPAVLAAGQTGQVWGSIRSLFSLDLMWLVADLPVAIWLASRLAGWRPRVPVFVPRGVIAAAALVVLAVTGFALSVRQVLASTPLDQMFRNRAVVEQLGPFGYHGYDTWNYLQGTWFHPAATPDQLAAARAWFAARAPLRAGGAAFGVARGKNLIVVQVESLQEFAVDYQVGGQEVMPHLRRWPGSVRFTHVTDQTAEGRTSDAEFVALTSLLPLDHGAVAFRYPGHRYVALPRLLADRGYATLSAVPFEPGFWNRRVMHPAYGFEQSLFETDFEVTEQIGWGLNDRDFLQQMVPRLKTLGGRGRPFAAWLITLSLHHPFENFPSRYKALKLGALENTSFGNYLHTMRFFDEAFEAFRQALAREGLLDQSVLMVFGDHDAGFPLTPETARAIGVAPTEVAWELGDRIPVFLQIPGLAVPGTGMPAENDRPAGQSDFAPTLLSLFGIDAAPLPFVGRNLFGRPDDSPILRPYGNWVDASHARIAHGTGDRGSSCYDRASARPVDERACGSADAAARIARDLSRLVVADDLQQRLRAEPPP